MRMLGLAFAVLLLWAGGAQARREQAFSYPYSRVWTAAVRMMRVDFESPITEKDRESGYFLFDYPDAGKQYPGSVEVVRVLENGIETARVVVQVSALPTYVEQMMLDRLARKLNQEFGAPQVPKAVPAGTPKSEAVEKSEAPKPEGQKPAPAEKK